jgi:hypothetical protein
MDLELVRKATSEYLFAQEFVLSYLLLLHDDSFGSIFSLLDKLKEKSKKNKVDDRLPRSAYFYLNNTIDLREDKLVEELIVENEEKKKPEKDSEKKKDATTDKANTNATKADTASLI